MTRGVASQDAGPWRWYAFAVLKVCWSDLFLQAASSVCPAPPECSEEPLNFIRAWSPKTGRVQRACDPDATWTTDCTFECVGEVAERAYLCAHFNDTYTGWMAGEMGILAKTTDGGVTWARKDTQTVGTLWGMHFVDKDIGWLVGSSSRIGTTSDGGETWMWQLDYADPSGNDFYGVYFHSGSLGWIVGGSGRTLRTEDGGASWNLATYQIGIVYYGVHFTDAEVGLVVGSGGRILWSNDGGRTWSLRPTGIDTDLHAAHCANRSLAFAVGYSGALLRTQDAGATWHTTPDGSAQSSMFFLGVSFATESIGWAAGQIGEPPAVGPGLLLRTQDGGQTWTEDTRTSLLNQRLNAVAVVNYEVPSCPTTSTLEPFTGIVTTTTKTTTTKNKNANAVAETELELLTQITSSAGTETRATKNETAAVVTAEAITLSQAVQQGGSCTVVAGESAVQVVLSAEVLAAVAGSDDAVVVITTYEAGTADWDSDSLAQDAMESAKGIGAIAAAPIAVNIGIAGAFASVSGLEEAIEISMGIAPLEGYACGFWNETTKKWSAEGVATSTDSMGYILCATTHLSVFAVVLSDVLAGIEGVVACTSVGVLSSEGFANLGSGLICTDSNCLWASPAFWIFWLFLRALQYYADLRELMADPAGNLSLHIATVCIRHSAASKLLISARDLKMLLEWARKTVKQSAENVNRSGKKKGKVKALKKANNNAKLLAFIPTVYECLDNEARTYYEHVEERKSMLAFGKYIFVSVHPWVSLGHFSIITPGVEQLVLLTLQVLCSNLAAAIWFRGSA
eukprot:CAMPEP_0115460386 /NCGR_PEP_ID=MMETSP0271-20121206/46751_1 /TAXON_ID=71861 /ORGANISM="Scrippsiella trochoidea, Strain CCMP3099" /LENGTH=794 /DNA_ID=CAMNT_0002887079 /DNA_START=49 /DNA_END=2430 /DNA_ORIENTATION=+